MNADTSDPTSGTAPRVAAARVAAPDAERRRVFFWVASYPRSGNTLVRVALSRILLPPEEQRALNQHLPEYLISQVPPTNGTGFPGRAGNVVFLKTHLPQPVNALPTAGAIYVIRHPVDVFLSGLHYLWFAHEQNASFRAYFGEDGPQSVESLAEAGKLDRYLDRFVGDRGLLPFQSYSATWVENVRTWVENYREWSPTARENTMILSYDHLVEDLPGSIRGILDRAGIPVGEKQLALGIQWAREGTKPDGGFYWRGSSNTKYEFFSKQRIKEVADFFRPLVGDGYF